MPLCILWQNENTVAIQFYDSFYSHIVDCHRVFQGLLMTILLCVCVFFYLSDVDGNDAPTGGDRDTAKDDTDSAREREFRTGSESTASEIEDIRTASEHDEVEGAVSAASELEDVEREPVTTSKQHRVQDHPEDRPVRPEGGPVRPEVVQDRPEVVQDRPEGGQVRPKSGPVRPKGGPVRPEGSPVRPEGGPVRPEGGPVRPEGGPVRPEGGLVTTSEQENIKNSISITSEPLDPQRRKKEDGEVDGVSSSVNNPEGQKKRLTRSSQGRKGKGFISPQNGDSPVAVRGRQTGDTGVSAAGTSVDVQSVDHHSDQTCQTKITQTRHSSQGLQPTVDDVFNNRQVPTLFAYFFYLYIFLKHLFKIIIVLFFCFKMY